ncbi:MAG: RtcB family protein [Candidatus Thermoplasmatota archaeon]|nr:RtcB family protein [Candidatus Thermoplasmatota archaeon]
MKDKLVPKDDNVYELPKEGKMRVPGRIYSSQSLLEHPGMDSAIQQVANVATLPGIVDFSMAMPDIHWGYGFPIGGVAAFRTESNGDGMGVISPGGVGFDINCGVRLIRTDLVEQDIRSKQKELVDELYKEVPAGLGSKGKITLSDRELDSVLSIGAKWASEQGYLWESDLDVLEENGCIENSSPEHVSHYARTRGRKQVGSLGSGNHFLEVQKVDEIFDEEAAKAFGLFEGQAVVMMHTGSRGCGHQVCQDHLDCVLSASKREGIDLPDKQLAAAPLYTREAQEYLGAMSSAANFAWANRSLITYATRRAFSNIFGGDGKSLGMDTVYDVSHNIAKIENHSGEDLCVHRKGATRAFGPGSLEVPSKYRSFGQPVIVPGDMGTASYVLSGTSGAMEQTFGSTCHGAGRALGRKAAFKKFNSKNLVKKLWKKERIYVRARSPRVASEEAPGAYKNVSDVVDVCHASGIANKVVKLKPMGVVKG